MIQYYLMSRDKIQRIIGLIIFLTTFLIGRGPLWILIPLSGLFLLFEWHWAFNLKETTSPYIWMILSPLLLLNYVSIEDFLIRTICFILLIYVLCFISTPYRQTLKIQLNRVKPITIYLISLGIFSLTACFFYFQNIYLSGDEPHYILIAQSIVEDGDVDLTNNMKEQSYSSFHPVEIHAHGIIHKQRTLPFHMPGLSFLLVPFYVLYKWIFPFVPSQLFFRLAASIINAFFALGLFFTIKQLFPRKNISGFWIYFICTFPLLFHAIHLYPELPAGALAMGAFLFGYIKKERYLLSGFFLSLIPWFHLKYTPVILVLAIAILYHLIKREKYRELTLFFIFPVISWIFLEIYCKGLYGTFNPAGIFPAARYWTISYSLKLKTLFAYFLDQRDGIFLFAPVFFLSFMCSRRKREPRRILMLMGISYLLVHAFTTLRGAYSPAGRPLMSISWIFFCLILNYHESLKQKSRLLLKSLMGFGLFTNFWLLYYPLFIYQPVYSHTTVGDSSLLKFLSGSMLHLPDLFPSFLATTPLYDPANCLWIGILGMTVFFTCNRIIHIKSPSFRRGFIVGIFVVMLGIFSFFPHIRLNPKDQVSTGEFTFINSSANFKQLEEKDTFRLKYGQNYHIYFPYFQLKENDLKLDFLFENQTTISIRNGRQLIHRGTYPSGNRRSVSISNLNHFKFGRKKFVHLGIKITGSQKDEFLHLKIEKN